jgi:hypothetical protein
MVRQHRTTAAVAITLALVASLAPIASADPAPLARAEAAITATHGSSPVRPNADQQTAPAGITYPRPCSEICSGGASSYGSTSQAARTPNEAGATLTHGTASPAPTVVRVVTHPGGFDWGDAGIGAAAALALIGIGLIATRAATTSRRRHTREQRAIVTN